MDNRQIAQTIKSQFGVTHTVEELATKLKAQGIDVTEEQVTHAWREYGNGYVGIEADIKETLLQGPEVDVLEDNNLLVLTAKIMNNIATINSAVVNNHNIDVLTLTREIIMTSVELYNTLEVQGYQYLEDE